MALLQRTRILPQQRLDKPDFDNIENFVCADFKASYKNLWSNENFVFKGFACTGTGTDTLSIAIADSALLIGADDGTMFVGAPSLPSEDTDALTPAATNYVEISIEQDTGGADSRAFWDPTAAGGQGGEFSQIVDTFIFTKVKLNINTSSFTGSAQNVPICEVDVNGSGIITAIRDARNLYYRLGRRGASNHTYPWISRTEPPVTQFTGADKDILNDKDWKDAVMSKLLEVSGTNYWFELAGPSLVGGFRNAGLSIVTSLTTDAKWQWTGSVLKLTDSSGTPADADQIAAIRLLDSTANLKLTRQDGTGGSTSFTLADGDVLWVELPDPLANVNYNAIGLTASNFRISARGSVPNNDSTFWLAFREGSNCFLRYFGELEPGESVEISDNINENILAAIGIALETDMPNYTSNNYVVDGTSLVAASSALDAELGLVNIRASQDRSSKLIEGGTWGLDYLGTTLSWSADAFIDVPEVTRVSNRILSGSVTLPNANSVAYVTINRASGPATLTVTVADVDAVPYSNNIVVIARRVSAGVLVGQHSFLLKPQEKLELDGALAEINRLLGQLRITKHETANNKARISAADVTLLNGNKLSQIIGDFLLKFDGAVINFTTGQVLKADDSTPLGVNFTPFSVPVGQYFWYALSLLPDTINADNTQNATVQVDLADSANASASAALKAVISGDIKLGEVQVFNNAGTIQINDINRLGVGSGSGSGSGDASAVDTALRDRFALNNMLYLTENIFRTDKATKVGTSTGAYAPAKKAFGFTAAAQTLVSVNHLDADFLSSGADITEIEFYLFWLASFIDTAATYEVSRDGGVNWQTASMSRIGTTNAWRAYHRFTDEVTQTTLQTVAATGAGSALNATSNQQLSSKLVLANASVLRSVDLNMNYGGAGVGTVTARLVKDNGGVPSTSVLDIVSESNAKTISTASLGGTGNITVTFDMPDVVLTAGTYHLVLLTDAAYKAGTLDLSWRSGAGTDGATYNGTSWTSGASSKAAVMKGRVHDLRVRVTSSAGDKYVEGYGVYYGLLDRGAAIGQRKIQKFVFSGDENRTDFTTNFELDPEIVTVYDPYRGQTYVVQEGVLRNEGNTLKFEPDTFDFPGETIVLIVRQLEGNGTDTSNANAAAISEIQSNLIDLGEEIASLSNSMILPKIVAPFTTVVNRAMIPDLSQDLKPRFGVDRVLVQQLYPIISEQGPNGEQVFGAVNDKFNQIRFVGTWQGATDNYGSYAISSTANDYLEITFYGTGLNILTVSIPSRDWRATVDGGSEGANFMPTASDAPLGARNYSPNIVVNVVNGLALGIHTVKIRYVSASNINISGFQILNEQASGLIQIPPGAQYHKGKKRTHSILETTAYNSGFETGALGTRGGRVLIYQKSDGSVAKSVTPTDASQLNMSSANHSNEEISRIYYWREFGAGRSDDIGSLFSATPSNRAFVLDDGTTTIVGQNVRGDSDVFYPDTINDFITITFVGTGLDFVEGFNNTPTATYTISVDGTNIITGFTLSGKNGLRQKVVSGLPYGTHTVKFLRTAGGNTGTFKQFIVYQPKTPTLPSGAVAIGAYNVMATNPGTVSGAGVDTVAVGSLRKMNTRELVYSGTWTVGLTPLVSSGHQIGSAIATTDYVEHTFWGTGFEISLGGTSGGATTSTLLVDGVANTSGFTTAFTGTGLTYTNTTGNVAMAINGGGKILVTGLSLGKHTIRLTKTSGAFNLYLNHIDVITPIHSHSDNGPMLVQNTLSRGSQGISDLRKFTKSDVPSTKMIAQAFGISSSPTLTSTTGIPTPDMSVAFNVESKPVQISYSILCSNNTVNGAVSFQIYVDGVAVGLPKDFQSVVANQRATVSDLILLNLAPGRHKVDVYWATNGVGTGSANFTSRSLTVRELE